MRAEFLDFGRDGRERAGATAGRSPARSERQGRKRNMSPLGQSNHALSRGRSARPPLPRSSKPLATRSSIHSKVRPALMQRGVMRNRSFRIFFAGQAVSAIGDGLVPVALAFAILDLTHSASALGIVMAAQWIPLLLFVLLGGIWADRLARQRVMLISDAVRAGAQATSAFLLLTGHARLWELALLQAVYGTAKAFFSPAATALVPETVRSADLQQANALLGLADNFAAMLGPALAGMVVATVGPGWGLAADGVTFAVSAAFLGFVRVRNVRLSRTAGALRELRAGWRAFTSRRWLWVTVAFSTLYVGIAWGPLLVLGPDIAQQALGGASAWAAIAAALGMGALLGGAIGLRWRPQHPLRAAFLLFVLFGPPLFLLLASAAPVAPIMVSAVLYGSAASIFTTLWYTALQRDVPAGELSRVSSWDYLGSLVLLPVGQAACGPVAAGIGLSAALYGAGGMALVLSLAVLSIPAVRDFSLSEQSRRYQGPVEALEAVSG